MTQTPAKRKRGNPGWYKGMPESPNPKGRPPGIVDKRSKLSNQMLDDAKGIVAVMVEKALEGDTSAASLVLARVLPALRSQSEKVAFPFDASAPTVEQVEMVLAAISSGKVAPDTGKLIIDGIQALSDIRAVEDLDERITILEAKQI